MTQTTMFLIIQYVCFLGGGFIAVLLGFQVLQILIREGAFNFMKRFNL